MRLSLSVVFLASLLVLPFQSEATALHGLPAPSPPSDSLILKARALIDAGGSGSLDSLRRAQSIALQGADHSSHRAWAHYYAALASYRLEAQFPRNRRTDRREAIDDAINQSKKAVDLAPEMSDAWALLARCYGVKTALSSPRSAKSLNRKSKEALAKAKQLAPENPRVWIVSGTKDYYTPKRYGGSKKRALKTFEKAARLAHQESVEDPLAPHWGHAEAYAWMGLVHLEAGRQQDAHTALKKALAIDPDYGRVRHDLMPRLNL